MGNLENIKYKVSIQLYTQSVLPHEGKGIKQQNSNNVEEQVYQGSLDRALKIIAATLSQGCQKTGERGPNIGAQKHRITGLQLNISHAHHGSQSGSEHRTGLYNNGSNGSNENQQNSK